MSLANCKWRTTLAHLRSFLEVIKMLAVRLIQTTTMRFTTFADLEETDPDNVKASSIGDENPTSGGWSLFRRRFSTSGSNNDSDGVYEAKKAGKACNFCMDSGKEARNKGDDDVRDLWKTQVSMRKNKIEWKYFQNPKLFHKTLSHRGWNIRAIKLIKSVWIFSLVVLKTVKTLMKKCHRREKERLN